MNMNFDFNNPTKILFGSGKLNELGKPCQGNGNGGRCLCQRERL